MPQKNRNHFPKERILDEAEALFAQKGYHAVTIREIIKAARCNLAAVNYHFGNKENLYLEVFRARWAPRARRIEEAAEKAFSTKGETSPTAIIEALARAFLEGPLTDEERQLHFQLMTREMAQPSVALDMVADQIMRPFIKKLTGVLRPLLPGDLGEERLILCIVSVIAMVIHFNFARVAVTRITGHDYDPGFRARLVEHIIDFSVKGLGVNKMEGSG